MRKEHFEEGEYYHIYNRGVDKRPIFSDDQDRYRLLNTFYILNNFVNIPYRFNVITLEPRAFLTPIKPYSEIVAGCFMPNHFHLMISQKRKSGISQFFQKVFTSYTKYFNNRHDRTGRLFESTFKARHVDRHEYASYLTQYIHLNPSKLFLSGARNRQETLKKVEHYPWSTLPDYLGKKSAFSLLTSTTFRDGVLDMNAAEYKELLYQMYNEKT